MCVCVCVCVFSWTTCSAPSHVTLAYFYLAISLPLLFRLTSSQKKKK